MTLGLGSGITGVAVLIWLLANVLCYAANENSWLSRVLQGKAACGGHAQVAVQALARASQHDCRLKFADPQPETFWCFDLLDPRDLV